MVHCFAIPLFVTLLPILGGAFLSDQAFHWLLLILVLPASIWALTSGCKRHFRVRILVIGVIGLSVLVGVGLGGHELFGEAGERVATSVGSAIVAIAHLMNYRELRVRG